MKRVVAIAVALVALNVLGSSAAASSGLVGRWQFDEGSGTTVADSSGLGNNGSVYGDVTWVPGHVGAALSFNGVGGVQVRNSASLEPTSTVTVSAWVKHAGSPGDHRYILAKGATGCVAASYALYSGANGGLEFYVSRNRGSVYAVSPSAGAGVWDGTWHFVVGLFDGTYIRLFVDGREVGSGTNYPGTLEYVLPDSNDLFIGDYPGCRSHTFVGTLDDVTVWNRALTPADLIAVTAPPGQGGSSGGQTGTSTGQTTGPSGQSGSGSGGTLSAQAGRGPALVWLRISPSTFAADFSARSAKRKRTRPTIRYTDTQAARSTFTVLLAQPGVREGSRCVAPPRRNRGKHKRRCTRYVAIGSFTHSDRAGPNVLQFTGVRGRKLAPGKYLLEATPSTHARTGRTVSVAFTVIR